MNAKEEALLNRLRLVFQSEAEDHLRAIINSLQAAEQGVDAQQQAELIEASFRSSHSLKGAARAVNLPEISTLCHALESVWAAVKQSRLELSQPLLQVLRPAVDTLGSLLAKPETAQQANNQAQLTALIRQLEQAAQGYFPTSTPAALAPHAEETPAALPELLAAPTQPLPSETGPRTGKLRVEADKLNNLLYQTEELLALKLTTSEWAEQLQAVQHGLAHWRQRNWQAVQELRRLRTRRRPAVEAVQTEAAQITLNRFYELLDWSEGFTRVLQDQLKALSQNAEATQRQTSTTLTRLSEDIKQVVVQPFSSILETLPHAVRTLAQTQGKEVELVVEGGDIEMDRRILQEMKDALLHLVHNSIDHGLETPAERLRQQKPAQGTLAITTRPRGGNLIEIAVTDDGRGIALADIKTAALATGLITPTQAEQMDATQFLALLEQSGFSTRTETTDISGRGLGLAILRERVERLGGKLVIETQPGTGTTIRILAPLTLANFRGVVVTAGGQPFIVPTTQIERVVRIERSQLAQLEQGTHILLDQELVPLFSLSEILALPQSGSPAAGTRFVSAFILTNAGKKLAFAIDAVLAEQEVAVKNLGTQLARVRNVLGASVLAEGRVVLILNTNDLVKSALKTAEVSFKGTLKDTMQMSQGSNRPHILIAEDSFTSRALLQSVLQLAGYYVHATADGLEAWLALQSEAFDLVVSDVEMPRLNGFDLTARIRAHPRFGQLPVILVTALASEEDRQRGVETGANAYLVKRGFEQQDLLEAVARLL
jgi:two-component system, chemotaxis family, sensor kinase CheA